MTSIKNTMILLIGHPGTGKYTVAKELAPKLNARVVDNHLINNALFQVLDVETFISEEVWDSITKIRNILLNTIEHQSPKDMNFIFTGCVYEEDWTSYREKLRVARVRGANFIPVKMVCDPEELKERLISPARKERMKLTNVKALEEIIKTRALITPDGPFLEIDVTHLTSEETADKIIEYVGSTSPPLLRSPA